MAGDAFGIGDVFEEINQGEAAGGAEKASADAACEEPAGGAEKASTDAACEKPGPTADADKAAAKDSAEAAESKDASADATASLAALPPEMLRQCMSGLNITAADLPPDLRQRIAPECVPDEPVAEAPSPGKRRRSLSHSSSSSWHQSDDQASSSSDDQLGVQPMVFEYRHDHDKKGVLFFLGSRGKKWKNPKSSGRIGVFASSVRKGRLSMVVDSKPTNQNFCTNDDVQPWILVDLKNWVCAPNMYTMANRCDKARDVPHSWTLEASMDRRLWVTLQAHVNDASLQLAREKDRKAASWQLKQSKYYFRYFRIRLAPQGNSSHTNVLAANCFELYGIARRVQTADVAEDGVPRKLEPELLQKLGLDKQPAPAEGKGLVGDAAWEGMLMSRFGLKKREPKPRPDAAKASAKAASKPADKKGSETETDGQMGQRRSERRKEDQRDKPERERGRERGSEDNRRREQRDKPERERGRERGSEDNRRREQRTDRTRDRRDSDEERRRQRKRDDRRRERSDVDRRGRRERERAREDSIPPPVHHRSGARSKRDRAEEDAYRGRVRDREGRASPQSAGSEEEGPSQRRRRREVGDERASRRRRQDSDALPTQKRRRKTERSIAVGAVDAPVSASEEDAPVAKERKVRKRDKDLSPRGAPKKRRRKADAVVDSITVGAVEVSKSGRRRAGSGGDESGRKARKSQKVKKATKRKKPKIRQVSEEHGSEDDAE